MLDPPRGSNSTVAVPLARPWSERVGTRPDWPQGLQPTEPSRLGTVVMRSLAKIGTLSEILFTVVFTFFTVELVANGASVGRSARDWLAKETAMTPSLGAIRVAIKTIGLAGGVGRVLRIAPIVIV